MARDAVVLEQALRWPKAASSRSGRSEAVFVGRRPELLGSGAAPLHAAVPRDHLRQLVGAHAAREGLALRRRQPAFFGEAPLRRRVAGHERGAGLRVLNFGPSPRAIGDRVLEKCGLEVSHRCTRPRSVSPWQLA